MKKKKIQVTSLAEAAMAEISGFEWEFAKPTPETIPGIGIGATEEAKRWAWIGYRADLAARTVGMIQTGLIDDSSPDEVSEILECVQGNDRARELVIKGLLAETLTVLEADEDLAKRRRGRPKKNRNNPLADIDARRAFILWHFLRSAISVEMQQEFNAAVSVEAKNRMLLDLAIYAETAKPNCFDKKKLFTGNIERSSLEQSISRGRKKLKIDGFWRSDVCEKIRQNY